MAGDEERDEGLLEAYLGVALKRVFSTGTEQRDKFKQMRPFLDTMTALA